MLSTGPCRRPHCLTLLLSALAILCGELRAQYPETIWVPVVYYDFHSDLSNPEFQMDTDKGLVGGMVLGDSVVWDDSRAGYFGLDSIPKPVPNPDTVLFSAFLDCWYRAWEEGGEGDYRVPNYVPWKGVLAEPPTVWVDHDTAFKNVVITDSLAFVHRGDRTFEVDFSGRDGAPDFFPLDGRGFGDEGHLRNYSFTAEMHFEFVKMPGMSLTVGGDDDIWVFIDGVRVIDLGGVHAMASDTISLDRLGHVSDADRCLFSLFFAERQTRQSTLRIRTDLFRGMVEAPYPPVSTIGAVSPPDDPRPTLTWHAVDAFVSYVLQVATDPAFGSVVYVDTTTDTLHVPEADLPADTLYWRVREIRSYWSPPETLVVDDVTVGEMVGLPRDAPVGGGVPRLCGRDGRLRVMGRVPAGWTARVYDTRGIRIAGLDTGHRVLVLPSGMYLVRFAGMDGWRTQPVRVGPR